MIHGRKQGFSGDIDAVAQMFCLCKDLLHYINTHLRETLGRKISKSGVLDLMPNVLALFLIPGKLKTAPC